MASAETPNQVTNGALGEPVSTENKVLEAGAAISQDFQPVKQICAHLNAFHVYALDPTRCVEANHYCTHLNEDVRQCLIYDSPGPGARLIGIEYMISPRLYATLPQSERRLWHTHIYEVKSGMLIMPLPDTMPIPTAAWETAEKKEMEQVIGLYGKTYHLWQVDRGDKVPMGEPQLMMSFTKDAQVPNGIIGERDKRFKVDSGEKKQKRQYIEEPEVSEDADRVWMEGNTRTEKSK